MADYEKMSTYEVQQLAKRRDKNALFEMVWRFPADIKENTVDGCAWQDFWLDKASEAGHTDAKIRYSESLIKRIMDEEYRKKAMDILQGLANDFNAGKLSGEDADVVNLWLGIMLCEGYHTKRDAIEGVKHIGIAENLSNGFEGYGFKTLSSIGEIFGQGLAQPDEEASLSDLEKSAKLLNKALTLFDPQKNKKEMYDHTNRYLELVKKRIELKKKGVFSKTTPEEAAERRKKMMEIPAEAKQRVEADKTALARLRQRLAREGW